jgi:ATP-dependent phosphofructokinase / diphosphate-dependent phosphofructokinase
MSSGNLMIVQGGGPTAVFNTSLSSIVTEALQQARIGRIFGARSGMQGLSSGNIIDLSALAPSHLAAIAASPGAALGTSRFKPTDKDLERCIEHLRQLDVRFLIFMGGNGTMKSAHMFSEFARSAGLELQVVGVPKTIDNDIAATDRCPGFGSAARFVAQSTLDLSMDIRSLPQPVSIFETLGRDVGWLAAAAALARRDPEGAPHLIYLPEIAFSMSSFLADLDAVVSRIGWAVVVVSEGIADKEGVPVFEQKISSSKGAQNRPLIGGVAQYLSGVVAQQLGIRSRSEKPGLIGRSSVAHVSEQDRQDAILVGREGVRALVSGARDVMIALEALPASGSTHRLVPLAELAGASRRIPEAWLSASGSTVTESFLQYMRPIVGELTHHATLL